MLTDDIPEAAQKDSYIRTAITRLEKETTRTQEIKDSLFAKLIPVLRDGSDLDPECKEKETEATVPLAGDICILMRRLKAANDELFSMLSRIDL